MRQPGEVDCRDVRPTRSSGPTLVGLLGGAVLVAVLLGQLAGPDPAPRPPTAVGTTTAVATTPAPDIPTTPEPDKPIGVDSLKRCPVQLGGLVLEERLQVSGRALERWDCGALAGPWSVVIRATGGHFGVRSGIVTFPAVSEGSGTPVAQPHGGVWNPGARILVWPLAGSHAQIVGDLVQTEMADLAMRITVEHGKPHLPALDGFAVTVTIPYGSPVVHEMRYGTGNLGQTSKLGNDGFVYTGVTSGASFESLAIESRAQPAGFVRGSPAIYSDNGGTGLLAWEFATGLVAYIGYTSSVTQIDAADALRALADEGRLLTPAQWETKDRTPVGAPAG